MLNALTSKNKKLVIGLMSGTSTDGIDAALVRITGQYTNTKAELVSFITEPLEPSVRELLLNITKGNFGGTYELSKANFLIGELFAKAALKVCDEAGISPNDIDLIGSHGHTVYHQPIAEDYHGHSITSTLQIGEASVISEAIGCPTVSDFRVRDIAAGGQGAPLVPYTEYLLYNQPGKAIALQNIGGIGNITFLPANGAKENIVAFDTGPGNMIIDALTYIYTDGSLSYDKSGNISGSAKVHRELLRWMENDPYLDELPPKTTGREYYGSDYVKELIAKANEFGVSTPDTIATATMFTARSIAISVKKFLPEMPHTYIIGGGGSYNPTLVTFIKDCLPECQVVTNEEIGYDSGAKEAIAFAVLANETIHGLANNVPSATGAKHPVIMGKLSF